METVGYGVNDGVATLTLNRPEVLNALTRDMFRELEAALDRALSDESVRAIVLAAEGKAFCAGFDMKVAVQESELPVWDQWTKLQEQRRIMLKLWNSAKPTVAAVQGHCVGAGYTLMNCLDLVVASDDAILGEPEVKFSMLPQPATVWLVGLRRAKELLMLGENFSAMEAYRMGIVNRVVPRDELPGEVQRIARRLAQMPVDTMHLTKRIMNKAVDVQGFTEVGDWAWDLFMMAKLMSAEEGAFLGVARQQGMKAAFQWARDRYDTEGSKT